MAISNFSELKTAVENWMQRSDLTTLIPDFITLAEKDMIGRDLRIRAMENTATGTMSGSTIALPSGFVGGKRFSYTVGSTPVDIVYVTPAQYSQYSQSVSRPRAYTLIGDNIVLAPPPDSAYSYTLVYYKRFDALSDSSPTNWLITNAPGVYLYAALTQAAAFVEDDDQANKWMSAYAKAVDALIIEDERDRHPSASTMRPSLRGVV